VERWLSRPGGKRNSFISILSRQAWQLSFKSSSVIGHHQVAGQRPDQIVHLIGHERRARRPVQVQAVQHLAEELFLLLFQEPPQRRHAFLRLFPQLLTHLGLIGGDCHWG